MKQKETEVTISKVDKGQLTFCILGTRPIILNRLSEKAKMELLMPKGRKNSAEKAANLKHNPLEEFAASPYIMQSETSPTYIAHLASAFKCALRGAALDQPGSSKSQIGRLTYIEEDYVGIYGVPQLLMSVTRQAGMNRTPDIRTRVIVPEWAAYVTVTWVKPLINEQSVINLLVAAGISQGVGDWRPEKGAGSYGQFVPTDKDDPEFKRIVKDGGRKAQIRAMEAPECYDNETAELLNWFDVELRRRGIKIAK